MKTTLQFRLRVILVVPLWTLVTTVLPILPTLPLPVLSPLPYLPPYIVGLGWLRKMFSRRRKIRRSLVPCFLRLPPIRRVQLLSLPPVRVPVGVTRVVTLLVACAAIRMLVRSFPSRVRSRLLAVVCLLPDRDRAPSPNRRPMTPKALVRETIGTAAPPLRMSELHCRPR